MDGAIGALDGWLCTTTSPKGVPNPVDYRSGHYGTFGINVQAVCDPDLRFLYWCVAAPGKTGNAAAIQKCTDFQRFLNILRQPDLRGRFFFVADNAYTLSPVMLIPFSGSNQHEANRSAYNFFLSQLRIRIEMAFGRLTNIWRIFRAPLEHNPAKCARIIHAAMRLHNFIIDMNDVLEDVDIEDVSPTLVANMHRRGVGYVPVHEVDELGLLYDPALESTSSSTSSSGDRKRFMVCEKLQRNGKNRPMPGLVLDNI